MRALTDWPLAARARTQGVLTDIDDTLAHNGQIAPEALAALHQLKTAGKYIIAITGRPLGWCQALVTQWPVDAIVAENGAAAWLPPASTGGKPVKIYQLPADQRLHHLTRMQAVLTEVEQTLGVKRSRDSAGRECDIAIDYAEFERLDDAQVQAVLAAFQAAGMHTTESSIHLHGTYQPTDKWQGACWIVNHLCKRDLSAEADRWVGIGDSGNDEALFAHLPHSVGVANIAHSLHKLKHKPQYRCAQERGAGFAEMVAVWLSAPFSSVVSPSIKAGG